MIDHAELMRVVDAEGRTFIAYCDPDRLEQHIAELSLADASCGLGLVSLPANEFASKSNRRPCRFGPLTSRTYGRPFHRPRGGDVPGTHRRDRPDASGAGQAHPPVYQGAALGDPRAEPSLATRSVDDRQRAACLRV
jgi:hypothetical protein